ncbi:MAG TPA: copper resistance CopC family protein [Casimicrobiaceae bacterium]|nr:copper resistance CopC family protein [Casimicrobiaceae bacterium]
MRRRFLPGLAAASALALASSAGAHAFLDRATPAVGSSVHGSPAELRLWFTQQLEPAFSSVQVLDRSGKRVDKGDPQVDRGDARELRVSLPQLAPGTYRVTWRVLSVDTHVTEGDFTFDVAP